MDNKQSQIRPESGQSPPAKQSKTTWILVGVTLLTLVAVMLLWLWLGKSDPENLTEEAAIKTTESRQYLGDITSQLQLKTIQLSNKGVQGLAVDQQTGLIYAGSFSGINNKCLAGDDNSQSMFHVIDAEQEQEVAAVVTDRSPIWPFVDPARDRVYLAASSGFVAVHKKVSGEKLSSINVGGLPHMPAVLGDVLVVSNTQDQTQSKYSVINLDSQKVTANHLAPKFPHPIVIDPDKKQAYMMGVEDASVVAIDMNNGTPLETFKLEGGGGQLALSHKWNMAVTDSSAPGSSAAIFDWSTKELLGTVGFDGANSPGSGLAVDEEAALVFVAISDQGAVGVASLESLKPLAFLKAGGCPYAVILDEERGRGYISNSGDGTITMFSLDQLRELVY